MVDLKDFPIFLCIVRIGNIMTPEKVWSVGHGFFYSKQGGWWVGGCLSNGLNRSKGGKRNMEFLRFRWSRKLCNQSGIKELPV